MTLQPASEASNRSCPPCRRCGANRPKDAEKYNELQQRDIMTCLYPFQIPFLFFFLGAIDPCVFFGQGQKPWLPCRNYISEQYSCGCGEPNGGLSHLRCSKPLLVDDFLRGDTTQVRPILPILQIEDHNPSMEILINQPFIRHLPLPSRISMPCAWWGTPCCRCSVFG